MVKIGGIYGTKSNWRVLRSLGRGGQGEVYEVDDVTDLPVGQLQTTTFAELLSKFDRVSSNRQARDEAAKEIVNRVRDIVQGNEPPTWRHEGASTNRRRGQQPDCARQDEERD